MTLPKQDQITSIGCSQDEEWEYELVPVDMLENSEADEYEYVYDLPDDEKIYKVQEESYEPKRRGRRAILATNVADLNKQNMVLRKKRKKKNRLENGED